MNIWKWIKGVVNRKYKIDDPLIDKIDKVLSSAEIQEEDHPSITVINSDGSLAAQKQMRIQAVEVTLENIEGLSKDLLRGIYSPTNLLMDKEIKGVMLKYIAGEIGKEEARLRLKGLL